MTADYTAYLESVLRDHEENVRKQAEARIQTETETIQREANKRLAINQIGLKTDVQPETGGAPGPDLFRARGPAGPLHGDPGL